MSNGATEPVTAELPEKCLTCGDSPTAENCICDGTGLEEFGINAESAGPVPPPKVEPPAQPEAVTIGQTTLLREHLPLIACPPVPEPQSAVAAVEREGLCVARWYSPTDYRCTCPWPAGHTGVHACARCGSTSTTEPYRPPESQIERVKESARQQAEERRDHEWRVALSIAEAQLREAQEEIARLKAELAARAARP